MVHVLVVLLHARFSVVSPIPFLLAAIFFPGHPYIENKFFVTSYSKPYHTTVKPLIKQTGHILYSVRAQKGSIQK